MCAKKKKNKFSSILFKNANDQKRNLFRRPSFDFLFYEFLDSHSKYKPLVMFKSRILVAVLFELI